MKKDEIDKTVGEIRADSPFPWSIVDFGMGRFDLVDANGQIVPLLRSLALLVNVTNHLAAQRAQQAAQATAQAQETTT